MLIAVEATRLPHEVRGIGRYVRAILPRLVSGRPGIRVVLFAATTIDIAALREMAAADPLLRSTVSVRHVREMVKVEADVHWYPWNVVDPIPRTGAVVVTMHDVAPIALPLPRWRSWYRNRRWRARYTRSARAATLIVADSAFTASEIQRLLGVDPRRMRVALLAADDFPVPSAAGDAAALLRLGVRGPYVLTVGGAEVRKNHAMLERAMRRVVAAHPAATLVYAGPRRIVPAQSEAPSWMRTLGFVSDGDLSALYRNASALVMPSTYEGFGLPVLEAMRFGTPVICARAASLPEVAGDAALWVSPDDDAQLADAIQRVLTDAGLRDALRSASLRQSSAFNWDETARRTLGAFDEAMELRPSTQRA